MNYFASVFALGVLLATPHAAFGEAAMDPSRVLLLANSEDPDSVPIAEHYAEMRHVPRANIVALPMPMSEAITWTEFVRTIWNPLEERLVKAGWIDAIAMSAPDPAGRASYAVSSHRISALVVCRGVPLKVSNDPSLYHDPQGGTRPEFKTDAGAVDSELSLLALPQYPISAYVPNPRFGLARAGLIAPDAVIIVSRLDGPTAADALALVDHAVEAERTGLLGRAYVDTGGPHANGDEWLHLAAKRIERLGFDLSVDESKLTFQEGARFDRPALYFGWYTSEINGPFLVPGFRFPPGAIALHIFSFSASSMRSSKGWTPGFVARGVTATVGNVYEPYLELTHRPDLLVEGLARGMTWGEAAYFALPAVSWQAIAIGDPLYRPFPAKGRAAPADPSSLSTEELDYATLRQAHLLESDGQKDRAVQLLVTRARVHPMLVTVLAAARALDGSGDRTGADAILGTVRHATVRPVDWGLAQETAAEAMALGDPKLSLGLYQQLLSDTDIPRGARMPWLALAEEAAVAAHDDHAAAALKSELDRLVAGVLAD